MMFLLSGEGPTDFGKNILGSKEIEFLPGPMVYFLDGLYQKKYDYSVLETNTKQFYLFSETELTEFAKQEKEKHLKQMKIPGVKNTSLKFHGFMARALGWKASLLKQKNGEECIIPVFFRDTDSNDETDYQEKLASIDNGFFAAGFANRGVAMLAKPKSEAWLLCLADNYQNGKRYEQGPANDDAPNSLKAQLYRKLKCTSDNQTPTREELCQFLEDFGQIDFNRLSNELPSFSDFMIRFEKALNAKTD